MQRAATAVWNGTLKEGKGAISTASGVLSSTPYSFSARFENGQGTNPEELIAAAHAGCFTMALSAQLSTMNFMPETLRTKATVSLRSSTRAGRFLRFISTSTREFRASRPRPLRRPLPARKLIAPFLGF